MTDYPPSWRVSRALGRPADAPPAAVVTPLGTRRIADRARAGMRAVIACTDATRAYPDALLVGTLLAELRAAGVRDDDISILIATGLHRPSTPTSCWRLGWSSRISMPATRVARRRW